MFKSKIAILVLIISTLFIGCGYKTTNTQIRDKAFIKFNKQSSESYNVVVNDKYEFKLDSCIVDQQTGACHDNTKNELYEVKSGNINIKVYNKDKVLILDKNIYVGSNNTVEVDL